MNQIQRIQENPLKKWPILFNWSANFRVLALTMICLASTPAFSTIAQMLPTPQGPVVLTITGKIKAYNKLTDTDQKVAEFDIAMLEDIGLHETSTRTPWTEGITKFSGVRLDVLLRYVGADTNKLQAFAYDGYHSTLQDLDFEKYPVIVATRRDNKPMSVRNLGPLWIIFPFDDYPELISEKNNANCVWQLRALEVL